MGGTVDQPQAPRGVEPSQSNVRSPSESLSTTPQPHTPASISRGSPLQLSVASIPPCHHLHMLHRIKHCRCRCRQTMQANTAGIAATNTCCDASANRGSRLFRRHQCQFLRRHSHTTVALSSSGHVCIHLWHAHMNEVAMAHNVCLPLLSFAPSPSVSFSETSQPHVPLATVFRLSGHSSVEDGTSNCTNCIKWDP